eukprot:Sspe_Gene.53886::Locus_29762_Transcript_1_1_Confidence_1.000_Length_2118::g.53886::m.53886
MVRFKRCRPFFDAFASGVAAAAGGEAAGVGAGAIRTGDGGLGFGKSRTGCCSTGGSSSFAWYRVVRMRPCFTGSAMKTSSLHPPFFGRFSLSSSGFFTSSVTSSFALDSASGGSAGEAVPAVWGGVVAASTAASTAASFGSPFATSLLTAPSPTVSLFAAGSLPSFATGFAALFPLASLHGRASGSRDSRIAAARARTTSGATRGMSYLGLLRSEEASELELRSSSLRWQSSREAAEHISDSASPIEDTAGRSSPSEQLTLPSDARMAAAASADMPTSSGAFARHHCTAMQDTAAPERASAMGRERLRDSAFDAIPVWLTGGCVVVSMKYRDC